MRTPKLVFVIGILFLVLISQSKCVLGSKNLKKCKFPAFYNFGDSNSDTGGYSAAFEQVNSPNGETFFGHPAGRVCDGRLIIDFLAERLKLPYLSPYLDSISTNFRHGANFAITGSTILPGAPRSPFYFLLQVSQFIWFKSRSTALYNALSSKDPVKTSKFRRNLPRPEDFSRALYTFDIGQYDLDAVLKNTTEQVMQSIDYQLGNFSEGIRQLYEQGARYFWIHNTGPLGCIPSNAIHNSKPGNTDQNGCVKYQNEVAQEFNKQLMNHVSELSKQLPNSAFTYVDVYSVKYQLISSAKSQGFVDPSKFCCGTHYACGWRDLVNGTLYGKSCKHPSKHISWDGTQYSEAANQWIAEKILNGSHSYPSFSVDEACHSS